MSESLKHHSFGSPSLLVLETVALNASIYDSFTLPSSSTFKPAAVDPRLIH